MRPSTNSQSKGILGIKSVKPLFGYLFIDSFSLNLCIFDRVLKKTLHQKSLILIPALILYEGSKVDVRILCF